MKLCFLIVEQVDNVHDYCKQFVAQTYILKSTVGIVLLLAVEITELVCLV